MNTTCNVCGKVCGNVGSLGSHKNAHEFGSMQGLLKCFICGKGYKSMSGLMYHKRNIHNSTVKSHSYGRMIVQKASRKLEKEEHACKHCPGVCLQQSELEVHYATNHKDQFPFVFCRLCNTAARHEVLLAHLRKHNCRGWGLEFMSEKDLENLVAGNSAVGAVKSFLLKRKSRMDLEFFGGEGYRTCTVCRYPVIARHFEGHLRGHNKSAPEEFEKMMEELPFCEVFISPEEFVTL